VPHIILNYIQNYSGKSTQVPQYLAEAILQTTSHIGNIICTQPRRISAISIAQRVSQEMGDKKGAIGSKGSLVGYQIRLESRTSDTNILQFCTTVSKHPLYGYHHHHHGLMQLFRVSCYADWRAMGYWKELLT
jgi:hypothetical protein